MHRYTASRRTEGHGVTAARFSEDLLGIPAQPATAELVLRLIADPNSSAVQLARAVESDPALTARVIRLANSPYYGAPRRVSSAQHAIVLLGRDTVRGVAAGAACNLLDTGADVGSDGCWRHALACGAAASVVAERVGLSPADAFSAGLLHDLGAVLLQRRDPDAFACARQQTTMSEIVAAEIEAFGMTHAEAGAAAVEAWGFPPAFVEAVALHQPGVEEPVFALGRVVQVGEALASEQKPFPDYARESNLVGLLHAVRLGEHDIDQLRADTERILDRLAAAHDLAFDRLRQGNPDRDLLVQVLERSCLRELAKLNSGLDLASCVRFAADIICAIFPVTGCAVVFDTADERPWVVESGAPLFEDSVRYRADILIDGAHAGELCLGPLNADLDAERFVHAAAAQLATIFAGALETERVSRTAATARAVGLAAGLNGNAPAGTLEAIVMQLAAFPGAMAAEILIDHHSVGAPLTVRAGSSDEPKLVVVSRALSGSGILAARVAMRPGAPTPDGAVGEVLDRIVGSLERIAREQQLWREVETDPLTGLGNRRRLDRALAVALSRARRYDEHFAVLLLDFDGFKAVNYEFGHEAGDRVLRNAARAAKRVTRGYDEVVRLGGDELVVVSPSTELFGALTLAESLRASIAESFGASLRSPVAITVSVGIALFPDSAVDADALLRAAYAALEAAKAAGKDRVSVAPVAELATATVRVPGSDGPAPMVGGTNQPPSGRPLPRRRIAWRRAS